jgi:NAD(P)-dependent dehydrogenase (short-subunit alcohol dehydrogenase family)
MSGDFQGKVALVTGSARGIGLTIARSFAEKKARVVIADINQPSGESAVIQLRASGHLADFVQIDLSAAGAGRQLIEKTTNVAGKIDILVNNARAGKRLSVLDETEENWDLAANVGIKSAFFAAQAAIRHMSANQGGAIVNIASVAAMLATNESASYHAVKAGLVQLTKYLAVAAGSHRVRVNCVLPGLIVQEEHRARFDSAANQAYRDCANRYQPLGQVGSESDVAQAVLYFCSEQARYVSGSCLVVDGGATVQDQFGMLVRNVLTPAS